jgi:hypothetical protein
MLMIDSWWPFVANGVNATIITWNHPNANTTRFPQKENQRNHNFFEDEHDIHLKNMATLKKS